MTNRSSFTPMSKMKRKTHIQVSSALCTLSHLRILSVSTLNMAGWPHDTGMYPKLTKIQDLKLNLHHLIASGRLIGPAWHCLSQGEITKSYVFHPLLGFMKGIQGNKCKFENYLEDLMIVIREQSEKGLRQSSAFLSSVYCCALKRQMSNLSSLPLL